MVLTQFIRDRTDVELVRLTRDTKWYSMFGFRWGDATYADAEGCLLCNAFDCRTNSEYQRLSRQHGDAEGFYIRLAIRNGQAETGAMIARLAHRELGRRALAAIPTPVASPEPTEVGA